MTRVVEAQRNDDAASWSPAGLADPLSIRRRRGCRADRSHSPSHHRELLPDRRSPNTSPAGAITTRPPTTKCPNTHSDRGTAIAPPPAGSFPAGFRTPAPVPAASSARAGIRNPQHDLPSDQVRGMSALYRFAAMGSYEAAVSSIFRPVARPQMATARPSGTALAFAPRPSFPAFLHQEVHDCQ